MFIHSAIQMLKIQFFFHFSWCVYVVIGRPPMPQVPTPTRQDTWSDVAKILLFTRPLLDLENACKIQQNFINVKITFNNETILMLLLLYNWINTYSEKYFYGARIPAILVHYECLV